MEALKQFIIMLVGITVFTLDAIFGILYTFFKHALKGDYNINKQLAPIFRSIALAFDGIDNACSGERYNDIYLNRKGRHPYGNWNETISAITGHNALKSNLSTRGKTFRKRLDKVFSIFGEKGSHVVNATKSN